MSLIIEKNSCSYSLNIVLFTKQNYFMTKYFIFYRFHWTLTFCLIIFCKAAIMPGLQNTFLKLKMQGCSGQIFEVHDFHQGFCLVEWNPNCVKISRAFAICSSRLLNFQPRTVYQIGCNLLSFFVVLELCPDRVRLDGAWVSTMSSKMPFKFSLQFPASFNVYTHFRAEKM